MVYLAILHLCEKLANPLRASADVDFPRGSGGLIRLVVLIMHTHLIGAFSEYMLAENDAFFQGAL